MNALLGATRPYPLFGVRAVTRVLAVVGTRPEAIKMAPVIQELRRRPGRFQVQVCATAQHREMLDQMFSLFGIVPDVDLDLMEPEQTPAEVAARVLLNLEPVLRDSRPDWILVQGDTTTVMAAALCANYNRVRVGHVEAGLRSFDRDNPFPEEMNRVVTDHVSDLLFAPTAQARQNLLGEGLPEGRIQVTGNTVIDALLQVAGQPWQPPEGDPLQRLEAAKRWVLVTAHRRENLGAPLLRICTALRSIAGRGDVQVIYPVHLNPAVWGPVHATLAGVPGVLLVPPLDYRRLVYLLQRSSLVLTDSGGIQEEAPSFGVPVLVLREVTERPEGVAAGTAQLVGTDPQRIVAAATTLLDDAPRGSRHSARNTERGSEEHGTRSLASHSAREYQVHGAGTQTANPYGDGNAAQRIAQALEAAG